MKVLREGSLPGEKWFTGTCPHCHCHVEFQAKEAKFTSEQRDGDFYSVDCPTAGCNGTIYGERK